MAVQPGALNSVLPLGRTYSKGCEEDSMPAWLTAGVKYLIPKNENTDNPKSYRSVTCLPTTYLLITSIISRRMQKYMEDENLLPK